MSTAVPSLPGPGPGSGPAAAGIDRYVPRFLLWLLERTEGDPSVPVPCAEFGARESIAGGVVLAVVERLRGHGMIRVHGTRTDDPVVGFEPAGADQARWLRARRADPAERGRHARRAVLDWIFAQADRRPLRIEEFFDSREVFFLGESLSRGEVARTVSYLADEGLVSCTGPLFHGRVGSHVTLTPLGLDAVLSGADVGRYVDEQRERARPSTGTVINGNVTGFVNRDLTVQGDFTVQHPLSAAELAELVRQFAPVLAPDAEARAALLRAVDELRATADDDAPGDGSGDDPADPDGRDGDPDDRDPDDGTPRPARQQGLLERIRTVLHASPDTVGRQVVLDAVGQAMARLMG